MKADSTVPALSEAEFLAGRDLGCKLLDEMDGLSDEDRFIERNKDCSNRGVTRCAAVLLGYIGKVSAASNSFALGFAAVVGDRIAYGDNTPAAYYGALTAEQMGVHHGQA